MKISVCHIGWYFVFCLFLYACQQTTDKSKSAKVEKTYYPGGQLLSEKIYSDNGQDWTTIKYFENGDTSSIAHYHNWKYSGEAIIFFPNGQKNFQQNYDTSGRSHGEYKLWNMSGRLKESGHFVHGKKEGTFKTFFDNGQVQSEVNYSDDKRNGLSLLFNEQGDTIETKSFVNGSLN